MKEQMSWREKIEEHFLDERGNYSLGLTCGITPETLIRKMKITFDSNSAEGREIINRARIELNAFCSRCCFEGYVAGAIGRDPSTYFIAQSKAEEKLILSKGAKNLAGRLTIFLQRGQRILEIEDKTKIKRSLKLIESKIPKETKKITM